MPVELGRRPTPPRKTRSNLILRLEDLEDFGQSSPDKGENWHLFNDLHSLNRRSVPNVLYFHLKPEEFDQIAGLLDAPEPTANWSVGRDAARTALQQRLNLEFRRAGEFGMRAAVGVFAAFVFALPVFLHCF